MMHKAWCCFEEVSYCLSRSSLIFQGLTANFIFSILTQIGHFRTEAPVWSHQWPWNDAQSLKQHRRVALLFFKVICQFSGSRRTKKKSPILTWSERFRTLTPVSKYQWLSNAAQSVMLYRRGALLFFKVIHQILRSRGTKKIANFYSNWAFPDCTSSLTSPMDLKWCTKLDVV